MAQTKRQRGSAQIQRLQQANVMFDSMCKFPALHLDSKVGSYRVDQYAVKNPELATPDIVVTSILESHNPPISNREVVAIRIYVSQVGLDAATCASLSYNFTASERNKSLGMLEKMSLAQKHLSSVAKWCDETGNIKEFPKGIDPFKGAPDELQAIVRQAQKLANDLTVFLAGYTIKPAVASNIDPLATEFIWRCTRLWEERVSRKPSRSRQGPFVSFISDAWCDLEFPNPTDRSGQPKPIEDYLGERVVKLL